MGKGAITSIRALTLLCEEFALNSLEVVAEVRPVLLLAASVVVPAATIVLITSVFKVILSTL